MPLAARPWITTGIAIVGTSLIAVTPVTPALPDLPDIQSPAVQLTGVEDLFNTASANATTLADNFYLAPGVGLQQAIVNQAGFQDQLLNGADPTTVAAAMQANQQAVASGFALINSGQSPTAFADTVADVIPHTLNNQLDLSQLGNGMLTVGHQLLLSQIGSFLPPSIDPATVTSVLDFLSSPASGVIIGDLGPGISPFVALGNAISSGANLQTILAAPLNGFLNGADLNLDALIPTIQGAGLLPAGTTINSLDLALGGLLTPGMVGAGPYTGAAGSIATTGGSIFNSLGLNLTLANGITSPLPIPGPLTLDVPSAGVGPIGALLGLSETNGVLLGDGWDGKNAVQLPPLSGLTFPTLPVSDMSTAAIAPAGDLTTSLNDLLTSLDGGDLANVSQELTNVWASLF